MQAPEQPRIMFPISIDWSIFLEAFDSTKDFLLYSNAKLGEIKGISLEDSLAAKTADDIKYEVIEPIMWLERPVAIDFHSHTQYIYFSDAARARIGRRKADGTEVEEDFISTGLFTVPLLFWSHFFIHR